MAHIKPLGDRVLVKPIEKETMTASGIILPETAKEKPQEGEIVAVGQGRRDEDGERIALDVEVGNKVLFAKYAGTEVKIGDEKYLIMKESDILGIIEA
ncbi:MAG UNVERIFIED_CONTAM: co-chaperone GroES [Anaerolineae bacterium]|jgi:chaperonin GroES